MTFPTDPSYTAQALRTESPITPALQTRLQQQARLVHAVLGLQTEAGELADPVKKHIYYGRPLDLINLREEIGDCLWYLALAADALGTTLEAEQARNLAKLRTRFPFVFTAEAAQLRDLDREREVLEEHVADDPHTLRQQLDAAQAEIETLKGAMAADDKRLRDAEQRIWPGMTWGCDAPDKIADAILHLRQQLAEQQAETFDVRRRLNEETDRHRATNAEKIELFQQKESANKHNAELVAKRDAALSTVDLQRAGIELLSSCLAKIRQHVAEMDQQEDLMCVVVDIRSALDQLDAGTQPTPVAEPVPCPECERLRAELAEEEHGRQLQEAEINTLALGDLRLWKFVETVRSAAFTPDTDGPLFEAVVSALDVLESGSKAAVYGGSMEHERLRVFFDRVRAEAHQDPELYGPFARLVMEFNGGSMEPTPVAEPLDAEGGK